MRDYEPPSRRTMMDYDPPMRRTMRDYEPPMESKLIFNLVDYHDHCHADMYESPDMRRMHRRAYTPPPCHRRLRRAYSCERY